MTEISAVPAYTPRLRRDTDPVTQRLAIQGLAESPHLEPRKQVPALSHRLGLVLPIRLEPVPGRVRWPRSLADGQTSVQCGGQAHFAGLVNAAMMRSMNAKTSSMP